MTGLWAVALSASLFGAAPADDAPRTRARVLKPHQSAADDTECQACHTVDNWTRVVFPHERTGFPLLGAHEKTTCKNCHPVDFVQRVPEACAGCHADVHTGDLGAKCQSCHDESSWKTTFTVDAHRRTNFPLSGRHAVIPCESCHGALRDQNFVRPTVDCVGCHQADFTRTLGTAVDHNLLQFGSQCRQCHDTWRFTGALYSRHDDCFQITGGPHAGIQCLTCHTGLVGLSANRCSAQPFSCVGCHDHAQSRTDLQHGIGTGAVPQVPGYQYKDFKCYQCHRFSTSP